MCPYENRVHKGGKPYYAMTIFRYKEHVRKVHGVVEPTPEGKFSARGPAGKKSKKRAHPTTSPTLSGSGAALYSEKKPKGACGRNKPKVTKQEHGVQLGWKLGQTDNNPSPRPFSSSLPQTASTPAKPPTAFVGKLRPKSAIMPVLDVIVTNTTTKLPEMVMKDGKMTCPKSKCETTFRVISGYK